MNSLILPFIMPVLQTDTNIQQQGNPILSFLPIILIIAIFYFLIIRPQNKKRKETEKMHAGLKKGDRVVTIGGLYGTIHSVKDTTVVLKADDNVKLEFLKSAISSIITQAAPKEEKIEEKEKEKADATEQSSENGE